MGIRDEIRLLIIRDARANDGFHCEDYAVIEFTHDEYGDPLVSYWVGKQDVALVSTEFLDEWFDNMDVPLGDGDIVDIWGLPVELVHYYPTRLLWAVVKDEREG